MTFVQSAITFINAQVAQVGIGGITVERCLHRRLLVGDTVGHLREARIDAGQYLVECVAHSITGTITINQLVARATEEDGAPSHSLCQQVTHFILIAWQINLPGLLRYLHLSIVRLASPHLIGYFLGCYRQGQYSSQSLCFSHTKENIIRVLQRALFHGSLIGNRWIKGTLKRTVDMDSDWHGRIAYYAPIKLEPETYFATGERHLVKAERILPLKFS